MEECFSVCLFMNINIGNAATNLKYFRELPIRDRNMIETQILKFFD